MNPSIYKYLNIFGLIFLIGMNMLAVLLPLGGRTTGELSALYPNLFVPSGLTFAIWSVIYILLIIFVFYQWFGNRGGEMTDILGPWFIINAIANGLWLFFWHYLMIKISFLIMLVILISLIQMYRKMDVLYFNRIEKPWQIRVPLSVYMGWITVATIANLTVVFVVEDYKRLILGPDVWAAVMLSIAIVLALYILYKRKDIFFAAVVCWAAFGIYTKRSADTLAADANIEHVSYVGIYILIIAIVLTLVQGILSGQKELRTDKPK